MSNYDFESKDFALSAEGVHLLRNRFNYKTIDFYDIDKAILTKAAETTNGALCLIAGCLLIAFAIYYAVGIYNDFYNPSVYHIEIQNIVIPVLPLLCGFYCIYIAVKKVPLLVLESKNKQHKFSLKGMIDAGRIDNLRAYLKGKLRERFYDNAEF